MPTFRILDQFPVYLDLAGNLAAGGSLKFYDSGTTTPRDVYADPDKSVNNGSTVTIGTDGRPVVDIWGDGAYRVRLYDADGTLIDEADDVEIQGGGGAAIPALESGKFLTNDGALLQWGEVLQPPDPTGSSGKILGNDGANLIWQDPPAAPPAPADPDIVVGTASLRVGLTSDANKFLIQTGSSSAPASGTSTTSQAVTFPTEFSTLLGVFPVITSTSYSSVGFFAAPAVTSKSTTGFTFNANVSAHQGGSGSDANINSAVPFDWVAFGIVNIVPPVTP